MSQRDDLLAGARACLAEKGYHRTTARDIAAVSGAHLASIGYHFGSKDALMTAAVLRAQDEWGDVVDAAVEGAGADAPADRLRSCVDALVDTVSGQREVLRASVQAYAEAGFSEEIRRALLEATTEARANLAAMALGVAAEDIDAETARGLGAVVHWLIAGLSLQALLDPASLPSGDEVAAALRTLGGDSQADA
ncbi:MAG TPA: TetR/AcrR family transcriptional regulator [Actinopolymorphaceae bacterium]